MVNASGNYAAGYFLSLVLAKALQLPPNELGSPTSIVICFLHAETGSLLKVGEPTDAASKRG